MKIGKLKKCFCLLYAVYEGLRDCCLEVPPENGTELAPLNQRTLSYKDYQPLWQKLCGCTYMKVGGGFISRQIGFLKSALEYRID